MKIDRKSDWAKWARFSEAILYILWFWQVLVWQITAYDNQSQIYIRRNNLKIEPMRMGFAQFWVNNINRPIFGRLRSHERHFIFSGILGYDHGRHFIRVTSVPLNFRMNFLIQNRPVSSYFIYRNLRCFWGFLEVIILSGQIESFFVYLAWKASVVLPTCKIGVINWMRNLVGFELNFDKRSVLTE